MVYPPAQSWISSPICSCWPIREATIRSPLFVRPRGTCWPRLQRESELSPYLPPVQWTTKACTLSETHTTAGLPIRSRYFLALLNDMGPVGLTDMEGSAALDAYRLGPIEAAPERDEVPAGAQFRT
jgi:hypothetical protein